MKTDIYYFSGTGNSLAVAKDLAGQLQDETALLPVARFLNNGEIRIESNILGLVFPVYCHDLPEIVKEFIKNTTFVTTPYIFAIATYNTEPGNALHNLDSLLKQKKLGLAAGYNISMPGNSVLVLDMTTTDDENKIRFQAKEDRIKIIARNVQLRKPVGIEGKFDPQDTYGSRKYLDQTYKAAEQFWVTDDCKNCKTCENVCPRHNIERFENRPVWGDNCEYCLACLHWCPEKAVQNGENSIKCRRYQHPDITVAAIMAQS